MCAAVRCNMFDNVTYHTYIAARLLCAGYPLLMAIDMMQQVQGNEVPLMLPLTGLGNSMRRLLQPDLVPCC
jgi:hypothetical protein